MIPRVILYNAISLDGRTTGFDADLNLYYGLAMNWEIDAVLMGSDTILLADTEVPEEHEEMFRPEENDPNDTRPLLVVPDSRGRIRKWSAIMKWPYMRRIVVLCSRKTPEEYIEYLEARHIDHITAGEDHVDLKAALEELNTRYGVKSMRVDSGGKLNGELLRNGIGDEMHVLIHPVIVGNDSPGPVFMGDLGKTVNMKLVQSRKQKGGTVWLKYEIMK